MLRRLRAVELLRLLVVASILGPAVILGLVGWFTYRAAFADARRELSWTSEVAREHASKVFDSFRLVTDRVRDLVGHADDGTIRGGEQVYHDKLKAFIAGLPQIESIILLDKDARLLVATEAYPVSTDEDFSDRDYFRALKSGSVDSYISRVQTSRVSGKVFFGWGRTRLAPDNSFDGVIDIAVSPDFFMRFYQTLVSEVGDQSNGRTVTMIRDDGQVLVRYPGFNVVPPVVTAPNPFFDAIQNNSEEGLYRNRSIIDTGAPERLFAFRRVPGHPVYIVAGRSISAIVAEWRASMLRYLAAAVPGTVALLLVTLATLRGARREQQALAQARIEMRRREDVEDQLRQAQKLEAVGHLTGGVAHDFNNLLTVIRSSVDLLRRPEVSEDRRRRYIEAISDTTNRAAKLTSQLLAFARRQALQPEVFDVVENVVAIGDMVRTLTGSRIGIEVRTPDAGCFVNADPSQFDTAIVNMAVNARDAMDGEGRLTVTVRTVDIMPPSRTEPARPGRYVAVGIADTGSGIPADNLAQIFEPFFTTKGVGLGTGLGLSQVFGFAKQSGGDVTVESEVGRGSTFTLYLPRVAAPPSAPKEDDGQPDVLVDGHGTCVLVVEDNPDVGAFASQTLGELGYRSVWVNHAEAALAELDRDAQRFDVVFSDVVMPGMSGIDLAQEIRRRFPDLPVVLTSGYSHVLAQNGSHGFELLQKPYSVEQLARVLRRAALWRRRRRALGG